MTTTFTADKKSLLSLANIRLELYWKFLEKGSRKLFEKADLTKGMHVIDVGCGDGAMTIWLAKQVGKKGKVTAIDKSYEILRKLEVKCKNLNINNVELFQTDISIFNKKKIKADLVYGRNLLMHVQCVNVAIENLFNFIHPRGKVIFEEPVISAFPDSMSRNIWQYPVSLYKKYCMLSGTNPDFGITLPVMLLNYGANINYFQFYAEKIDSNLAKKYINCSLGSAMMLYNEKKIANISDMKDFLKNLSNKMITKDKSISFHTIAQAITSI